MQRRFLVFTRVLLSASATFCWTAILSFLEWQLGLAPSVRQPCFPWSSGRKAQLCADLGGDVRFRRDARMITPWPPAPARELYSAVCHSNSWRQDRRKERLPFLCTSLSPRAFLARRDFSVETAKRVYR